ncbi:hypothetical protein ACFY2W_33055 [Streptomyces sp. NPDC001262]|uniref:hypothetical protein n=1 Tax=Streptomyces sp. NPDC001262 TaxID=3364552 RepID=UPI0036CA01F1
MRPPTVPLYVWWAVAIVSVVAFMAVYVPMMPNRRLRIRVSCAPVAMAVVAVLSGLAKGIGLAVLLPLYSAAVLSLVLGVLGHGREMREKTQDIVAHGNRAENKLSSGVLSQLAISIVVLLCAAIWFASKSL